jgi:hypothetical protein
MRSLATARRFSDSAMGSTFMAGSVLSTSYSRLPIVSAAWSAPSSRFRRKMGTHHGASEHNDAIVAPPDVVPPVIRIDTKTGAWAIATNSIARGDCSTACSRTLVRPTHRPRCCIWPR